MATTLALSVNGHYIEVVCSSWSAKETVYYDGQAVSEKRVFAWSSLHTFSVEEAGEIANYEVQLSPKLFTPFIVVRRNGIVAGHN